MILFLFVIIGKEIVEDLELRVAKGIIKMWKGPALVDRLFDWIGSVDWDHSNSQGKGDSSGVAGDMIHIGSDIATYVSEGVRCPIRVFNVMSLDWSCRLGSEESLNCGSVVRFSIAVDDDREVIMIGVDGEGTSCWGWDGSCS